MFGPALRTTLFTLVLTGLAYPAVVTGLGTLLFPDRAAGSLVTGEHDRIVGSELIAQPFRDPGYFQPRPSAAGDGGWDGRASSPSNLGPSSAKLRARAEAEIARLVAENPDSPVPVPAELVSASGSGLDPEISPAAARWQIARVARARHVAPERIAAILEDGLEARTFGLLGEPRVNVLTLNLALDRRFGRNPSLPAASVARQQAEGPAIP